jgi:hypothetical protein
VIPVVSEHKEVRHLTETVIYPEHANRTESEEFRKSKERLREDGHYKCWVCGCEENLQVHHFACEWSLQNDVDFEKLKQFVEEWDPYGYGKLLKNKSITSADDLRNMLVLCQEHHTGGMTDGIANGIHDITFPIWIIQKLAKKNVDPVPTEQEG